jgi:MSHA biogenesis protein MshM
MIYLDHFGLREAPFALTPDTDFFFAHAGAQAALNTVLVALRSGEGFVKIVGEVGCGKTVLCRRLLQQLQGECATAYIPNPRLRPHELLAAVGAELGVANDADSTAAAMRRLQSVLLGHALAERPVVICIDEAQAAPMQTIEALRLLSNLETEKRKLLQIVLFGQPELDRRLADPAIRQFRQRISFSDRVQPLALRDVPAYVKHRLEVAGAESARRLVDAQAVYDLAQASGGVPRVLNQLAHKSLMLAYGQGAGRVTARHVRAACEDTPSAQRGAMQRMFRRFAPQEMFA